jgi:RES domain-containing protein
MTESATQGWDARRAVARADIIPIKQAVWRGHRRRYGALDPGGSLLKSGRFHQAGDQFPNGPTWPALYTACELAAALGEIQRSIVQQDDLISYRFTEIWAQLERVLDCRDLDAIGVRFDDIFDDYDYSLGQQLGRAATDQEVEALLVPSATRLGDNLVIFPHLVRRRSVLVEVRSIDPNLIKRSLST